jgi:nucleoside triphosphate pyrophosphatase
MPAVLLASDSPRRRAILERLGVEFESKSPGVAELRDGVPRAVVLENARLKAGAVHERRDDAAVVLGADTDVLLDGRLLGKPDDASGARAHLEALSGRTHTVLGGLVLMGPADGEVRSGVAESQVSFRRLSEDLVGRYLDSGEWEGRAGAYAIQGLGSILVERVEGDLSNVIGLPVRLLVELAPELLPAPSR